MEVFFVFRSLFLTSSTWGSIERNKNKDQDKEADRKDKARHVEPFGGLNPYRGVGQLERLETSCNPLSLLVHTWPELYDW